LVLYLIFLNI